MNEKPLYICYSLPLMLFLREHGVRYEVEAKHKITECPLWVYIRTDNLNKVLDEWRLTKETS